MEEDILTKPDCSNESIFQQVGADLIEVYGAADNVVNGDYSLNTKLLYDGTPAFTNRCGDVEMEIMRYRTESGIQWAIRQTRPTKIDKYTVVYGSNVPPEQGWIPFEGAPTPSPKLRITFCDQSYPKAIEIFGREGTNRGLNGKYQFLKMHGGRPAYKQRSDNWTIFWSSSDANWLINSDIITESICNAYCESNVWHPVRISEDWHVSEDSNYDEWHKDENINILETETDEEENSRLRLEQVLFHKQYNSTTDCLPWCTIS